MIATSRHPKQSLSLVGNTQIKLSHIPEFFCYVPGTPSRFSHEQCTILDNTHG